MSGAVFLDFRKAFDLVHHDILLNNLSTYNLSIACIAFLRSYLQDCLQCILINGTYSQETSTSGVRQRSILGPLLFCIFINDLLLCLTRASVQCDLFADDGTFNTANDNTDNIRRDLQQSLYDVSGWCCRCEQVLFVRFYNNPAPLNGSMQFHYCTLVTREPEQTTLLF